MNTVVNSPTWLTACIAKQQAEQSWLRVFQAEQGALFLERGLPNRHNEQWKYTDVSYLEKGDYTQGQLKQENTLAIKLQKHRLQKSDSVLMVFVNGHFAPLLSDLKALPASITVSNLQKACVTHADLIKNYLEKSVNERNPFSALNAALLVDGLFLHVPKNICIATPIHIVHLNANQNHFVACPRQLIMVEEGAEVTILEEHISDNALHYFSNMQTDIYAESNAKVNYHKIQNEALKSTHIAQTYIHQKSDSRVSLCALEVGGGLARDDVLVNLNERGAECSINGFYALNDDDQHIDNHIQIDHIAPHGNSQMMYKGILDKKSRAVFNGKIFVHPGAQKTRSNQANHNLLLSSAAQVDTKPEFEIYADDVKCAHGDTVGQLDTESLFYLRSRGIDKETAFKLLTRAFADDVMNCITHAAIADYMNALLIETFGNDD